MPGTRTRNASRDATRLIATAIAIVGCEGAAPAPSNLARAADDSAVFASLPPTLARALDVRAVLTPDALRDTTRVVCESLRVSDSVDVRRRLRALLPDSARTVLFVRARRGGALRRVELVRRAPGGAQRGFIWDAQADAVRSVVWARAGAGGAEVTTLPRGGPLPSAIRALGARLLALPCPRAVPNAPARR